MSTQSRAQGIISAVQSEPTSGAEELSYTNTPGALVSIDQSGTQNRAVTDFGVNKIYSSTNGAATQYASSAWLDSYTVAGAAGTNVHMSFAFTVDGMAAFNAAADMDYNFKIVALRGTGWTMSGAAGTTFPAWYSPSNLGDQYESLILNQNLPALNRVTRYDMRDPDGFYNYANAGGQPGAFSARVEYFATGAFGDYYVREYLLPTNSNIRIVDQFYADRMLRSVNGGAVQTILYASPQGVQLGLAATRAALVGGYSMLDSAQLCDEEAGTCNPGVYEPTTLNIDFDMLAGSSFTLVSWLMQDDLENGTIDFFNTARVTGVTVSAGGSLTSASGTLTALPGGGYGYPAAASVAAVPEPASWAMMVGGIGLLGAALRRRRPTVALA